MNRAPGVSRRGFLGAVGMGAGAVALAGCSGATGASASPSDVVSPYGVHQAGITTPQQDQMAFAAFDVVTSDRDDVAALLRTWTAAIERMAAGLPVADDDADRPMSPPRDTGEAEDLPAANLTVTVGFGSGLFDDRFGLAARRPAALEQIPPLPGDALQPTRSGGDLCVQACADDPQVAFHAMRVLRRLAQGTAALRWTQLGFGKGATNSTSQPTPRNLMGFKDGTNNLKAEVDADMRRHVWVGEETDQPWLRGGTYLVARRIAMRLESWDRDRLEDQEAVFGRVKSSGAPLGARREHDPLPLTATRADGSPVIAVDAHVRRAHSATIKILRRGYNYTDGTDPVTGQLDAGLFFICFQKDPRGQFVPLQQALAEKDALNEYIVHTSSAVFACPPGFDKGGVLGAGLF